ncbi:MAG: YchF/TatD family DNA exonuclease [Candidatus Omnitrophica bacterium]|nr:YchF/TatD family DNA exonuclease [Candidatus Omnitrophota bacterium]
MILIDTHCHLDFPDFDQERDAVIERAKDSGVAYIINIGSSVEGSKSSVGLAKKNPIIYATVGVHPHYAKDCKGKVPGELKVLAGEKKVVAIGEVGLDYYRNLSPKDLQKRLFIDFIRLAKENNLPLVIHTREAHADTLKILKDEFANEPIKGVMHCFSADEEYLKECLEMGLHISFTCNITFKNAKRLRALASKVPIERLLLETDAPFLAPQNFRGKRNEPSYLTYLVEELSRIYALSAEDIARITTHNAKRLFGLPLEEESRIVYPIRESLYINITNRCTNKCNFCVRNSTDFVKGHNLKLDKEPSADEIMRAVKDPSKYREIVFCGYGEPTLRLDVVKEVAGKLKKKGLSVRMVTNGEGNLIHKRSIAGELKGLIDKVSVSLNVDTREQFDKVCKSEFGPGGFDKVKEFIKECKDAGIKVEVTFLDLPGVDLKRCKRIAEEELKVDFRLRRYNVVG